jgi:hypothetical protein
MLSCLLRQHHIISKFIAKFLTKFIKEKNMSTLAAIRAKLAAQDTRSQQNQEKSQNEGAIYPFWNMTDGSSSVVRFLPDADTNNSYFWVERSVIKLPFPGVRGQNENKQVLVQVPCMEMYGENCPILAEVRTWYKDESLKETANKYWKKRSYLFQGFVRTNSLAEDSTPENPIRRFVISPQIFALIKNSLMDPEIEEMPTDYLRGLDFKIVKSKKGEHADYSTSSWARKESALTESEMAAIELHGLYNLREFLPKKPSESEARIIREMFDASVDGQLYDVDRWGAYYKPWGLQGTSSNKDDGDEESSSRQSSTPAPAPRPVQAQAPKSEETPPWTEPPVQESKSAPAGDRAQDILAMIRSRQNKTA